MNTHEATIYEVAQRAGVSISTVSLAINHPDRVREVTRDRILAIADQIGFVPKERAIARAKAGVGRLALVAPFTSYPSFSRRMVGALEELAGDGTQLLVYDHEDIAFASSPLLGSMPVKGHVDGLIIMDVPIDAKIGARLRDRLPTVLIGAHHEGLARVYVDDFAGGRLAGEKLAAWGHTKVAFIRETESSFLPDSPTQQRRDGLAAALGRENVIEFTVGRTLSAGQDAISQLVLDRHSDDRPTAIFANRDLVALSVWRAALASGISVPGELSIVGYDDDPTSEALGLTTIHNPFEESGRVAIRALRKLLESGTPTETELPLAFVDRQTAGPLA